MFRALCGLTLAASVASAETHHLKPTVGHPTFAVRPPVLTVKPGDVLTIAGVINYQACDDRVCYLPESVPLEWNLPVAR